MLSDEPAIPPRPDGGAVTGLLSRWSAGQPDALDELAPVIYEELRRIARSLMRNERPGNLLEATGLVHEAFLRIAGGVPPQWGSRGEFYAWATKVMRHVLVDHARARLSQKRGGGIVHVDIDDHLSTASDMNADPPEDMWGDIWRLNEALARLELFNAQHARVVELRFFGDLGIDETAEVMRISATTVKKDWTMARAWLLREIRRPATI